MLFKAEVKTFKQKLVILPTVINIKSAFRSVVQDSIFR